MARAVRWDLIANERPYVRGFDRAEQRSRRFQRHMGQLDQSMNKSSMRFAALGGAAAGAAGAGITALGGLAAAGIAMGLKTAAGLESAEIGFTQLLKSSRKAKDFIADLKTFAARTPFELPGLVDASRALLGAGVAARNVIPIMTALGDASGALGLDQERFGRVMTAVTQIMNKGKVQAEELMQINEAGIPVWQLLAKATGKPVPELQKLMEQGKLLSKDVLPGLFEQMRKDYGGGMEKQSKSLSGVWSTFKDTVLLTLSDALQPLLPWLKEKLPEAGKTFQRSIEAITNFFKDDLGPQLGRIKKAWDDNKASFDALITSLNDGEDQMGSTKDTAKSLADSVVTVTNEAGKGAEFMTNLGKKLNTVEHALDTAGKAAHDHFTVPFIDGLKGLGNVALIVFAGITHHAANLAEALHLPIARGLRGAERAVLDYRVFFNQQMDQLKNEDVVITATPGFRFTKNFSKADWVAARIATGRMAGGGRITGGTGPTADDVPIMVSRGETVVSAAHSARPDFRAWAGAVGVPGFAQGGAVLPRQRLGAWPKEIGQLPGVRHGIATIMGNWTGRILDAALKKLVAGSPAIKAFIRSTDPLPYIWGGAGPGGYDCSGLVSAVLGKMTGRGGGHGQRYFTTASIHPGILGIKPGLGGLLQIGVTPSRGHMVGRYGGLGFEAESTRTGIKVGSAASRPEGFARKYHLAGGGRIGGSLKSFADLLAQQGIEIGGDPGKLRIGRFDGGGWLMPGTTVATNRTGAPERVVGPQQQLIDDRTIRKLADAIVEALHRSPIQMDRQRVSAAVATGALLNARLS